MARLDDYGLRGLCGVSGTLLKGDEVKIRYERTKVAIADWKKESNSNNLGDFYQRLFEGTSPADPAPQQ